MSASESSPLATNLEASIQQLVAETVRRSQTENDVEQQKLRTALEHALSEVEQGQAAMARAGEILRTALGTSAPESTIVADESSTSVETVVSAPEVASTTHEEVATPLLTVTNTEPHEIDIVAHNVTLGIASGLQSMLRERPEVQKAQTREFVDGELRLHVDMTTGLDMPAFSSWVRERNGTVVTSTESVIELRFES